MLLDEVYVEFALNETKIVVLNIRSILISMYPGQMKHKATKFSHAWRPTNFQQVNYKGLNYVLLKNYNILYNDQRRTLLQDLSLYAFNIPLPKTKKNMTAPTLQIQT